MPKKSKKPAREGRRRRVGQETPTARRIGDHEALELTRRCPDPTLRARPTPLAGDMRDYVASLHAGAALAWDRDVHLPPSPDETIAFESDDAPGVLARLLLGGELMYRLFVDGGDPLGCRWTPWIGPGNRLGRRDVLVEQVKRDADRRGFRIHYRPYPELPARAPCGRAFAELTPHEFSVQPDLVTCEACRDYVVGEEAAAELGTMH